VIAQRNRWRQQLVDDYEPVARRLVSAYDTVSGHLQQYADDLTNDLLQMVDAGVTIDRGALQGMTTYQRLLVRTRVETQDFARRLENEMTGLQENGIVTGANAAQGLSETIGGRIVTRVWNEPDPEALSRLINYVDSPAMQSRFATFGENAATNLADTLLNGIAQGLSPRATARMMRDWIDGVPLSWANNSARTVQLYSYRFANHQAYRENSRVLDGWIWSSSLDARTCLSCLSLHGKVFPLSAVCNDHHSGRCSGLPLVKGATWMLEMPTGEEWFNDQPAATQREMMGPGMYDAWKRDQVNFNDLSREYSDDVYGTMRRVATLRELGVR
jgi:hypothetical protein